MPKIKTLLFGVAAVIAAWFFFQKFDLQGTRRHPDCARRSDGRSETPAKDPLAPPPARSTGSVRVATFNIQVFGKSKASKPQVMDVLARIVRNFDLVAIQEIRSSDDDLLPNFVELINSAGAALRLRDRAPAGQDQQHGAVRVRFRPGHHRSRPFATVHGGRPG